MTTVPLPLLVDALPEDGGITTGVTMVEEEMPETVPAGGKEVVVTTEALGLLLLLFAFRLEDEAVLLTFDDEDTTGTAPTDVFGA